MRHGNQAPHRTAPRRDCDPVMWVLRVVKRGATPYTTINLGRAPPPDISRAGAGDHGAAAPVAIEQLPVRGEPRRPHRVPSFVGDSGANGMALTRTPLGDAMKVGHQACNAALFCGAVDRALCQDQSRPGGRDPLAADRRHRGPGLPGLAADHLPARLAGVAHLPRRGPALRVRPRPPCRAKSEARKASLPHRPPALAHHPGHGRARAGAARIVADSR